VATPVRGVQCRPDLDGKVQRAQLFDALLKRLQLGFAIEEVVARNPPACGGFHLVVRGNNFVEL